MNPTPLSDTAKAALIRRLIDHVINECSAIDVDSLYDEMLNECYSLESVGGPFSNMDASRVLKEVDPIAYRCGMSDYMDSNRDFVEIEGEYYFGDKIEEAREEFASELHDQLSEATEELEEHEKQEGGEDSDADSLTELRAKIARLTEEISIVEGYSF